MYSNRSLSTLALAVFSSLWGHSAFALTTEHGTICKPYGYTNTAGLYAATSGVYNYSGGNLGVACPVVRTISAPAGGNYSVWVDGTTAAGTNGSCTLYSYNYNGTFMGSVSTGALPAGNFTRLLTLTAAQVPYYSSQMVYCYLPPNGAVRDVEPVQ
jgi:hypothetical protein